MRDLLYKEMRLSASPLSYLFLLSGFMFLVPGYPILCAAFFVCLGLFQSFQSAREANDIVFSALLPVPKKHVVKGKFLFVCLIELCALALMALCVLLRMTALSNVSAYRENALMNANFFALAAACVIFALFNLVFVAGFFRTAYKFGRPFVCFIVLAFISVAAAEALHHIPGCALFNAFGTDFLGLQLGLLAGGCAVYALLTLLSYKTACARFEKLDL